MKSQNSVSGTLCNNCIYLADMLRKCKEESENQLQMKKKRILRNLMNKKDKKQMKLKPKIKFAKI